MIFNPSLQRTPSPPAEIARWASNCTPDNRHKEQIEMAKNIWRMGGARAVESSPGLKTNGEYSGLYRTKNASALPVTTLRDEPAQRHLATTTRQLLNAGEPFSGFIAVRQVDHVILRIGHHPVHGISAHADRPTSHAGGKIEVITASGKKVVSSRNDFFGQLLEDEIPESQIEAFCIANWYA